MTEKSIEMDWRSTRIWGENHWNRRKLASAISHGRRGGKTPTCLKVIISLLHRPTSRDALRGHRCHVSHCKLQLSADPQSPVLNLVWRANPVWGVICYGGSKAPRKVLRSARFPKEKGQETVQIVEHYSNSKILRIRVRSIFSTEGSFGLIEFRARAVFPEGPKIQHFQEFPSGLRFSRDQSQIEKCKQDSKFQARWKIRPLFVGNLDGRNRAGVIAESLARVIAAIRIASVHWRHISLENTESSPHRVRHRPCVRCAAIRIARLAFICLTFVPHGIAEWLARVDCVRWTLAISDWRFCPSKVGNYQGREWNFKVGSEHFKRDWNFQAWIANFKRMDWKFDAINWDFSIGP